MKFVCAFFFLLINLSCERNVDNKESLKHFNSEISARMEVMQTVVVAGDSMKTKCKLIDEEVLNLILISKDIENISASVYRANAFFDALAAEFRISITDFIKLHTGMHVDEIELILRQNELNLFNQIIFKYSPQKNTMYTAQ